ncbi:MAG: D-sedoheptulose 7-phosphate isomerase [Magnetococcales bacterium]|nr:D-sedoheptulose 7-phosphate isomerase [Magnetococcales bacterium]
MIAILDQLREHQEIIATLEGQVGLMETVARKMTDSLLQGGKILWLGNGGSAADSQHLCAELVSRLTRERRALASIALTTDTSILTAVGNDYSFERIFARQVEALARPGDVVVGISTSGQSPNVIAAMRTARAIGAITIGFAGRNGGALLHEVDHCLVVSTPSPARAQEGHILIGHILCDWIEAAVMASPGHV